MHLKDKCFRHGMTPNLQQVTIDVYSRGNKNIIEVVNELKRALEARTLKIFSNILDKDWWREVIMNYLEPRIVKYT